MVSMHLHVIDKKLFTELYNVLMTPGYERYKKEL